MTTARRWRTAASITSLASIAGASWIVLALSAGHHGVAAALVPATVVLAWASTAASSNATRARWAEDAQKWQRQYAAASEGDR